MIHTVFSACYFNPLNVILTPWKETLSAYTLRWMIRGDADVAIDSTELHLRTGQILICPPHSEVTVSLAKESEVIYATVSFDGDLTPIKNVPFRKAIDIAPINAELLFQFFYTASQYYRDTPSDRNDETVKLYTRSLLEAFLARLDILNGKNKALVLSEPPKTVTQVNDQKITFEIKQYLTQHLSESIALNTLSEKLGVSVNTAMHVFKKNVGMGIIAYFTKLKIEKAMKLIAEGELSFRTVSEQLGFESPEYFSRVFKKQTGMTPTEYAKQQNKWSGCLATLFM